MPGDDTQVPGAHHASFDESLGRVCTGRASVGGGLEFGSANSAGEDEHSKMIIMARDRFTLLAPSVLSDSTWSFPGDHESDDVEVALRVEKSLNSDGGGGMTDEDQQHLSSNARTFMNLLISFIGAGILGIPYAFRQGGLFLSLGVISAVGIACTYCMWMLVRCKHMVAAIRGKGDRAPVTYADVCGEALGKAGLIAVEGALVFSQSGFSAAYLVFIARNLHALFDFEKLPVVLVCLPGLVLMCLIKHLKYLAPFSLLAEMVNLTGLAVVFFDDAEFMEIGDEEVTLARWQALPFVFGVSIYCFEGMGMILPIESAMINTKKFTPILSFVMFIFTGLCIMSGALGYMAFGDDTKDIILLNIGSSVSTLVVKLSFCVGLYFTFPIMMVPVWEVLEFKWLRRQSSSFVRRRNILRAGVVLGTGVTALVVPNFGLFVSLIGSSCCALLALILPTLCYASLSKTTGSPLGIMQSLLNNLLLVCGVLAMILGTVDTLHKIVAEYSRHAGVDAGR